MFACLIVSCLFVCLSRVVRINDSTESVDGKTGLQIEQQNKRLWDEEKSNSKS